MLRITMTLIVCFFAAVGIVSIYNRYILSLFEYGKEFIKPPYIVITAKNQQENIETVIRSFIWKNYALFEKNKIFDISVVDLGSYDDTLEILKQLEKEYNFLHIYTKESYLSKIGQEL